ncbi:MAG: D-aminoacylase [Chloroflexi bacterium]|nr:D-aminoacylase [Chloroflexota bacterium]
MFDLLISGGRVVDGTGQTWFRADVGIQGDTLTILRGDTAHVLAGRVIDATGYVVCPGFIDMHSHSDLAMLSDPRHEPKVRQGVTTEALGMDGLSYAPISPQNLGPLLDYLAALNGYPPADVRWGSVKEFLALFEQRTSCNVVYFLPHAAVRIEAMGWEARLPTAEELQRMQDLVRQGMRDGAFGFATGLTYIPGAYSDTNEVVELCRAVSEYGGIYVTHCRYSLGDTLLDPFREAIAIGRQSGVPVQISHYHNPVDGMGEKMLALIDESRHAGVDVTFDQYPYAAGSTLLHSLLPYWVHAGGPQALLERIQRRQVRDQIQDDIYPRSGTLDGYIFSHINSEKNKEWEGRSLVEMAQAQDKRLVDTICDLLIEENLGVAFVARTGNPDNIRTILRHPAQMVSSDGLLTGDKPNPRTYGTFPYVLGQFVREEKLLRLEEAVRKMTAIPAQRLGLKDRGILRDGMKADIVIFNPDTVQATATFEDPKQFPIGIDYVLVNGRLVIDQGQHTGAFPGRALRLT